MNPYSIKEKKFVSHYVEKVKPQLSVWAAFTLDFDNKKVIVPVQGKI